MASHDAAPMTPDQDAASMASTIDYIEDDMDTDVEDEVKVVVPPTLPYDEHAHSRRCLADRRAASHVYQSHIIFGPADLPRLMDRLEHVLSANPHILIQYSERGADPLVVLPLSFFMQRSYTLCRMPRSFPSASPSSATARGLQ